MPVCVKDWFESSPHALSISTLSILLGDRKMTTASILTITLLYLVGLRQADKRQNKVSKDIEWLRQDVGCYLIDL